MKKLSKRFLFAVCAVVLFVADLLVVTRLARKNFKDDMDERMNLHSRLCTLEFDANMSKSLYWTSDSDLEFWSDMKYSYTVNPSAPSDYWYNMNLYETEENNFNINYNDVLKSTSLWVNAVVRDNGKPVGTVGTGIPIQQFTV